MKRSTGVLLCLVVAFTVFGISSGLDVATQKNSLIRNRLGSTTKLATAQQAHAGQRVRTRRCRNPEALTEDADRLGMQPIDNEDPMTRERVEEEEASQDWDTQTENTLATDDEGSEPLNVEPVPAEESSAAPVGQLIPASQLTNEIEEAQQLNQQAPSDAQNSAPAAPAVAVGEASVSAAAPSFVEVGKPGSSSNSKKKLAIRARTRVFGKRGVTKITRVSDPSGSSSHSSGLSGSGSSHSKSGSSHSKSGSSHSKSGSSHSKSGSSHSKSGSSHSGSSHGKSGSSHSGSSHGSSHSGSGSHHGSSSHKGSGSGSHSHHDSEHSEGSRHTKSFSSNSVSGTSWSEGSSGGHELSSQEHGHSESSSVSHVPSEESSHHHEESSSVRNSGSLSRGPANVQSQVSYAGSTPIGTAGQQKVNEEEEDECLIGDNEPSQTSVVNIAIYDNLGPLAV